MVRKESVSKTFAIIKDYVDPARPKSVGKPKFFMDGLKYGMLGGEVVGVKKETKKITPKEGTNAGKEITVHNLLVDMIDSDGSYTLQVPLYSQIARNILNALAGDRSFDKEFYFSVYKNKSDYRTISIKDGPEISDGFIEGKYKFEEINAMVTTKKEKGEDKKDYNGLMDKLLDELMPIITKKLESLGLTNEPEEEVKEVKKAPSKPKDDDDLPF